MGLTAPQVDWWIERLRRTGFEAVEIEEDSQRMLKELFGVTDAIEAVGDDGLMHVPMDDAGEFEKWKDQKGDYYEFNGHHPYEIRTSMSSRLAETDRIGILPDTVPAFYARYGDSHFPDDVLDHINLYNEDLADRIVAKAEWLEQETVRLKTI